MTELLKKQLRFSHMVASLITTAHGMGYQVKLLTALRTPEENALVGGHKRSLHMKSLAIDLALFKDGVYLKKTEEYARLGKAWQDMGGTWGGGFTSPKDGNHFSLSHGGVK